MCKRVAVLFSGGIDSSYTAVSLLKQGYDVTLIHFDNGAMLESELAYCRYNEIKKNFDNVSYISQSSVGFFRRLALKDIEQDFKKFNNNLICLGCRYAMHTKMINYCLQNEIYIVADGAMVKQNFYSEQTEVAISFFKAFYMKNKISYINPVYLMSKEEIKYGLFDEGITIQSMENTCLFNGTFSTSTDEVVIEYLKSKEEDASKLISVIKK